MRTGPSTSSTRSAAPDGVAPTKGRSLDHVGFEVQDLEAFCKKLEAAGVQVNEMWDSGACHGAGFRDPDGNAILLHHRYKPREQDRPAS